MRSTGGAEVTCDDYDPALNAYRSWKYAIEQMRLRMKAGEICHKAAVLVSGDRDRQHGTMEQNFANIARLWSAYLRREISPKDVALLMALLKVARTQTGANNADDYFDGCGYIACAGQLAGLVRDTGHDS